MRRRGEPVTHIRRDVMVGVLTGGLLVSSCGDDRHGTTGGTPTSGTSTSGAPTGAAGQAWLTAIRDFNKAMNDFATYYRDDYRSPVPDDFDGRDSRFAFLFGRQDSLMTNLDYLYQLHDQLGPALDDAIAQDAIPAEGISALKTYVQVTARWLAVQWKVGNDGFSQCLTGRHDDTDRPGVCIRKIAVSKRPQLESLADEIDELAGWLATS
jgi:hypothetical protein